MITLKDLRLAINRQLSKTGHEVNSRDVQEGFNRPSFFVVCQAWQLSRW